MTPSNFLTGSKFYNSRFSRVAMPASRSFIANFSGGELSPLLDARVDASPIATDAGRWKTSSLVPTAGHSNVPGLEYGGAVKTAAKATRLIPFKRSRRPTTNWSLATVTCAFGRVVVQWLKSRFPASRHGLQQERMLLAMSVATAGQIMVQSRLHKQRRRSSRPTSNGYWHAMTSTILRFTRHTSNRPVLSQFARLTM